MEQNFKVNYKGISYNIMKIICTTQNNCAHEADICFRIIK